MDLLNSQRDVVAECKGLVGEYNPGPLAQLKQTEAQFQEKLTKVQAAIKALEENPKINEVLELVTKGLRQ